MAMGTDIWGNPDNLDVHGNYNDRNIHGNRPMDIHGNTSDGSSGGGSSFGGSSSSPSSSSPGWPGGSVLSGRSGGDGSGWLPSARGGGSGPAGDPTVIHLLAAIGMAMIGGGLVVSFLVPSVFGISPLRVAAAGIALFVIAMFPKLVGFIALSSSLFLLYTAGATPGGWAIAAIPDAMLVAGGVGVALGAGLVLSALTPLPASGRTGLHRTLLGAVILPVAAIVTIGVVARPSSDVPAASTTAEGIVTASALHVRSIPSQSGAKVGTLRRGDRVVVTGPRRGDWFPVLHQQRRGYVAAAYLSFAPDGQRRDIVARVR